MPVVNVNSLTSISANDGILLLTDKQAPDGFFNINFSVNGEAVALESMAVKYELAIPLAEKFKNKICFVMPIYPPHYEFARKFLSSFNNFGINKQADVAFVFTNEDERNAWDDEGNFKLVMPPEFRLFFSRGIINIKKFWALNQLKDLYEYFIVIDSETIIIKDIDIYTLCNKYFSDKVLLGNQIINDYNGMAFFEFIKNNCKRFFKDENQIKRLNSNLYLWFNQPCIYRADTLRSFFAITGIKFELKFLTWFDFDYYIYMYYLILYHNFNIKNMDIVAPCGACELAGVPLNLGESIKKLPVYMSTRKMHNYFNSENIFMIIHTDRGIQ